MGIAPILGKIFSILPFMLAVGAGIALVIIGFNRHGWDFMRHDSKQTVLDASIENRLHTLETDITGLKADIDRLSKKVEAIEANYSGHPIETNHSRHLKNYLSMLSGALLDKQIINNETKARLDNELRGM